MRLNRPLVIGHRGAPRVAMENTLASFEAAIASNVDMIELDVQVSSDGHLIIFHDDDFKSLVGDDRLLSEIPFEEILEIGLSKGIKIPELDQVLDLAKGKVMVDIELKAANIEQHVLQLIRDRGMLDDILFSSFKHDYLVKIRDLEPYATTGILYSMPIENVTKYAKDLKADAINPLFFTLEPSIVEDAHAEGLKVYPWTPNDKEMISELIKMGVDGIITDVPEICFELFSELGI